MENGKRVPIRHTRHRQPNFENLLKVLRREAPDRPTLFEFVLNKALCEKLTGMKADEETHISLQHDLVVHAFRNLGFDFAPVSAASLMFPRGADMGWHMAARAEISDRASFNAYPWPDPDDLDYSGLAELEGKLPEGMKLIVCTPHGGVFDNLIKLVGFETISYLLADEPDLVADICEAIGSRLLRYFEIAAQFPAVGACLSIDDWAYKTGPMLSPKDMRRYIFPWHRKIVEAIHATGKPAILHCCGNRELIMDDITDDMQYDGVHANEDGIQPVEETYEQYRERIAVLGGIDLDFLCRSTPEEIRRRSKAMLERAAARGGYALGTGNSVPPYVPDESYLALVSTATGAKRRPNGS